MSVENLNLVLDFMLVFASFFMIYASRKWGGYIGDALNWIVAGALVFGLAHLLETTTYEYLGWNPEVVEFSHRLVLLVGFLFFIIAFRKIRRLS